MKIKRADEMFFALIALTTLLLATASPILGQAGEAGFKVVDFQGSHPLSGARVVAVNTADPSERLEATADQSGFVRIEGIKPDANYTVEIYWSSPSYKQESELVFKRELRGSDILEIGEVRVNVFTVKLVALDGSGESLDWISGVEEGERQMGIILDGVDLENLEVPLAATADLVPQGEHELKVIWDGYTVYNGSIYVGLENLAGYIPGLDDPEKYQEDLERLRIAVKTKTADLTIQIYYPDGRRVEEAGVDIIDVNGVIKKIGFGVRAIKGADTWGDLPTTTKFKVILYWHYSWPWEKLAEVTCVPGSEPCEIRLRPEQGPFYTVRVRARYPDGEPAPRTIIVFNYTSAETNEDGVATFYLVRPGTYRIWAASRAGEHLSEEKIIRVSGSEEFELTVKPLEKVRVELAFQTKNGRPYEVVWSLSDGVSFDSGGKPSSKMVIEELPAGNYTLRVEVPGYGINYTFPNLSYVELGATGLFTLPIADTRIFLKDEGGKPIPGVLVRLIAPSGKTLEAVSDPEGAALFRDLPLNAVYEIYLCRREDNETVPVIPGTINLTAPMITLSGLPREELCPGRVKPKPTTAAPTISTTTVTEWRTRTETATLTKTETVTETATITRRETVTAERVVEREVVPAIPLLVGIVAASIIIAVAILVASRKKPS